MAQALVNGLVQGAMYAIIALGYTLVYGILLLINFAHGEIVMIGAYTGVVAMAGLTASGTVTSLGVFPCLGLALVGAMVACAMYGLALERAAYRPLRHAPPLSPLISAIGASIFLQNFVMLAKGNAPRYAPTSVPEYQAALGSSAFRFEVAGATVTALDLFILAICVALMVGLYLFVMRTRLGTAMRAVSMDKVAAGLMGIDIDRVIAATFVIGSALAAVAGLLLALYTTQASFDMGYMAGLKAFTAAVLGGIGNVPGAMLGGVLLGLAENLGIHWLGGGYKHVYAFVVLLVVLIVRPRGIMGERVAEKV